MKNVLFAILYFAIAINALNVIDQCIVSDFNSVTRAAGNCNDIVISDLFVPPGEQLLLKLRDGATATFRGNTTFGYASWDGPLIKITGNGITVQGEKGHVIDGRGELYWDGRGSWGTLKKPKFMLIEANNSLFQNLHIYHAPMHGVKVNISNNLVLTDFFIDNAAGDKGVAPDGKEGHNTDGFGIGMSKNIIIKDSSVYNQDDCVVVNSGSDIHVYNMLCHGSHGLSISVGFFNDSDKDSFERNSASNVLIENSTIIDSMDGIHIKTHLDAGHGLLSNVTYRNIFMVGSYFNGIAIEQNYTNQPPEAGTGALPRDNIPIKGLTLDNIRGTVLSVAPPIYIVCAKNGCSDWEWKDIFISGQNVSSCVNFHPGSIDCVDFEI